MAFAQTPQLRPKSLDGVGVASEVVQLVAQIAKVAVSIGSQPLEIGLYLASEDHPIGCEAAVLQHLESGAHLFRHEGVVFELQGLPRPFEVIELPCVYGFLDVSLADAVKPT